MPPEHTDSKYDISMYGKQAHLIHLGRGKFCMYVPGVIFGEGAAGMVRIGRMTIIGTIESNAGSQLHLSNSG